MALLVYTVLGLTVTWLLYVAYMNVATRAAEGRSAASLHDIFPSLRDNDGRFLVYCYSPQCGPCRPMSKEVDSLIAAGEPVFKLDLTQHPEASRELGIRATPTLILIEHGRIARMVLGVKLSPYMRDMLKEADG